MTYLEMASTTFNEKTFIAEVLKTYYYDYAESINTIFARHYFREFGNDIEKKNATIESYTKTGEYQIRTLYDILYFKVNKAIDDGEMDVYYGDHSDCDD